MRQQSLTRRIVLGIVACVIALVVAEIFMRAVLPITIEQSLWYTGDIHTKNDKYVFVFTPGYQGWMRHSDQVFLERLTLDSHGFRRAASHPRSEQDVVMLGGYSMAFSYGLGDDDTLNRTIGNGLAKPSTVYNTAWPGFNTFRNFHIYRDLLENEVQPEFAVILLWEKSLAAYGHIPEDPEHFRNDAATAADLFVYFDHHAVEQPDDWLRRSVGKLYYRSIIAHKLSNLLYGLERPIARLFQLIDASAKVVKPGAPTDPEFEEQRGAERFQTWTDYLQRYFGGSDKVLFVFLPRQDDYRADRNDPAVARLPAGAHYLLRRRCWGSALPMRST